MSDTTGRDARRLPLATLHTLTGDTLPRTIDVICLSHLRWDFVFQRPQHLLTRCAHERRVFFVEEPLFDSGEELLEVAPRSKNIWVARVHLPRGTTAGTIEMAQRRLLDHLMRTHGVREYALWYYTPMALPFARHLAPRLVVYDCMDELSNFKGAPPELKRREEELMARADVVFCGGYSLWEVKRERHANAHAFPSSIDAAHFATARVAAADPPDQAAIGTPRLGYFGVIDERIDYALITAIADARPDWQIVLVGPVVKVDPDSLPRRANIHYLGAKKYAELPAYIAGWDVALMPFARNEATRFISPTKTPEYLAAGKPVVSTAVRDVVRTYGETGLVAIADNAESFVAAADLALREHGRDWLARVDELLAGTSWDATWRGMADQMGASLAKKSAAAKRAASRAAASGNESIRPAVAGE